jgi:hypothetical protein
MDLIAIRTSFLATYSNGKENGVVVALEYYQAPLYTCVVLAPHALATKIGKCSYDEIVTGSITSQPSFNKCNCVESISYSRIMYRPKSTQHEKGSIGP